MTALKEGVDVMRYRSRLEIYVSILKAALKHHRRSRIMYEARISPRALRRKLAILTGAGLLVERNAQIYLTAKGAAFMVSLCDISEVLEQIDILEPGMFNRE